jgi:hypothetical protein
MKKMLSNKNLKNIGYVLGYWVVFVITPYLFLENNYHNDAPIWIGIYILFIAPFLYFIPYLFVKPKRGLLFIYLFI